MKFWYALNKNITSQPGRFVYEVGGAPRPEECLPEVKRSEVLGASSGELAELQEQFENEAFREVVNFIKTESSIATQRQFLANHTLASTQLGLDPNLPENVRTAVTDRLNAMSFTERAEIVPAGIIDDILRLEATRTITLLTQHPETIKKLETPTMINLLREISVGANTSTEAREIIVNQTNESDLVRFISTNPELIPELFSRQEGDTIVATFYGNNLVEREISPIQLIPENEVANTYLRASGADDQTGFTYRPTANGYRAFYAGDGVWGSIAQIGSLLGKGFQGNEKARVFDGHSFTVASRSSLNDNERDALAAVETPESENYLAPHSTETPDYAINQAYALNFKMLANGISLNLPDDISAELQTDIQAQAAALRVFLDGRRFLLDGEMPTRDGYGESVLAGLPPIDYNASPAEVRATTEAALFRITNHFENQILARYQAAQAEGLSEPERVAVLAEAAAIQVNLERIGASLGGLIQSMQADSVAVRDQNQLSISTRLETYGLQSENIQSFWEQLDNPELSSLEKEAIVNQILAEAEASFRSLDTINIPEEEIQTMMDSLRRDLLTHARNSDAVDQGIQLTQSLRRLEFLSTYRRDYFYPVLQVSQDLGITMPAALVSAFAGGQFEPSHVKELESFVRNNQESYQAYFNSPAGRNTPGQNVIQHFLNQDATAEFKASLAEVNQAAQQKTEKATKQRENNADWVDTARHQLQTYFQPDGTRNLDTPEALAFHQGNDLRGQAYTQYYREHGVMPPPEARLQIEQSVTHQVHTTQLQDTDEFKQQSPEARAKLYSQIYQVPSQTNIVGLTSSGQLILESGGTDQTRFIQSPTDGTIIAEHLTGVPDSEDLRVPPEEWATAQALGAMTDSFVVKSAAELAQAGEKLGNRGLVNYFKQYWGIRGNQTLPESELDKFKNLGEMMSDNHINLHTVLAQLNAVKWDDTADGSRALDVRLAFNEILETAAAGNNSRFRELLNLDTPKDLVG